MQRFSRPAFFAALETASGNPERGGLLLQDDELVELANVHPEPLEGYMPDPAEVIPLIAEAVGTWHSHPGRTAQPSSQDAQTFAGWPDWTHVIVGLDGVRAFRIKNGMPVPCE